METHAKTWRTDQFIKNLRPNQLSLLIRNRNYSNIDEAFRYAVKQASEVIKAILLASIWSTDSKSERKGSKFEGSFDTNSGTHSTDASEPQKTKWPYFNYGSTHHKTKNCKKPTDMAKIESNKEAWNKAKECRRLHKPLMLILVPFRRSMKNLDQK